MDKPLVVLVHGTRTTKEEWTGYAELLPEAEVVAFDLPGHGTRQQLRFTRTHLRDAFEEAVGLGKPGQQVILVGHSLGGYLSSWFAASQPANSFAALVLVGASGDPHSALATIYRGFPALLHLIGAKRMTTVANRIASWVGMQQQPGPELYEALEDSWRMVFEQCSVELLSRVDCPIWLINGQYDQMRLHANAFSIAAGGAPHIVVPGATHLLPMTHRQQLAEQLNLIVRKINASDAGKTTR